MECIVEVTTTIEFQQASLATVGSPPSELAKVEPALEAALEAPGRKVLVIGHAADEEAETEDGREKLRTQRAEEVRTLLIGAGLPADRLFTRTRSTLVPSEPHPAHRRFVSFELDPADAQRTDAMAREGRGDRPWCD